MAHSAAYAIAPDVRIGAITDARVPAIEHLLDLAFGVDRHGRTAYRLREGVSAEHSASFSAFDAEGVLIGSLQSWPLALTDRQGTVTPLWLVGPIAVHPERQNEGIGRTMLSRALSAIDRTPHPAVLIGDPDYYAPFGFTAEATGGWSLPGPVERHRLLARIRPGCVLPTQGMLGPRAECASVR